MLVAAIQLQTHGGQTGYELCSGFLVSATKFVTAAHCFPDNGQPIYVSFDGVTSPAAHVLVALNPVKGTVTDDKDYCPACGINGTPLNDVAVITFLPQDAQTGRGLAALPTPVGFDDLLAPTQAIDVVGYGWSGVSHKAPTAFGTRQVATTETVNAGVLGDNYLALLEAPVRATRVGPT
jgi:hypothetical protein